MIEQMKLLVNSHACISTYLQIDQDSSSRRDDSSSKYVSRFEFSLILFFEKEVTRFFLLSGNRYLME